MARWPRPSRIARRWIVALVALLVVLGGGGVAWAMHSQSSQDQAAPAPTPVAASVTTLRQGVATTGTLAPKTRSDLSFPAAGTVTAVSVAAGDTVKAGQVLATMDATDLTNAVKLAQANLDAANAQLTSATAAGNSTQIASAQAQVNATTARLASATTALSQASITSPIDGLVASVGVAVGDHVSGPSATSSGGGQGGNGGAGSNAGSSGSGSGSSASTVAVTVISQSAWTVSASVSSNDLPSIAKGQQAEMTASGSNTKIFGTVSGVGVVASGSGSSGGSGSQGGSGGQAAQSVATFPVTIDVTGTPQGLYSGTTMNVSIITKQVTDALTVPTGAIFTENGQTVVHRSQDGKTVSVPVQLGMVQGNVTQITSGLQEGDEVLVEGRSGRGGQGGQGAPGSGSTRGSRGGSQGGNGGGQGGWNGNRGGGQGGNNSGNNGGDNGQGGGN